MDKCPSTARAVRSVTGDYDAACKRLLSEKQVLSRILHDYLDEFSGMEPKQIEKSRFAGDARVGEDPVDRDGHAERVLALANEDKTVSEGTVAFDIRFDVWAPKPQGLQGDGQVRMEIDVEAQNKFSPGYPLLKRCVFYGGRMLSMQGDSIIYNSRYERVRKVVSIWVCAHPAREYAGTATCFDIVPNARVGDPEFAKGDYDLLEVVLLCLNDKEPGKSDGALGMLEVLLAPGIEASRKLLVLSERYGIIITEEFDEKVKIMCNLSEGLIEEGYLKGRKAGWEIGCAEGRSDERASFLKVAASMVRDGLIALQVASERFGFTEQEIAAAQATL